MAREDLMSESNVTNIDLAYCWPSNTARRTSVPTRCGEAVEVRLVSFDYTQDVLATRGDSNFEV